MRHRDRVERGGYPEASMTDHPDFSVVVKNRGRPPSPWKWEIYRAGRASPVKQSEDYFSSVTEANRVGKKALSLFLSEYYEEVSHTIRGSCRNIAQ
jgi:hypothetical protein